MTLRRIGWMAGAPLAAFRFLTRETGIEVIQGTGRSERAAGGSGGEPPPDFAGTADQPLPDSGGVGPVLHRVYTAAARKPRLTPEKLLDIIAADPNVIAPAEVLRFERTRGEPGDLRVGDELRIRMAGPWDGPVRVTHRDARSVRLTAMKGNAMLGQVELRVAGGDDAVSLEIRTHERAALRTFRLLQRAGVIGRMQMHTWAAMLENAAQVAGACRPERVTVEGWRGDGEPLASPYEA